MPGLEHVLVQSPAVATPIAGDSAVQSAPEFSPSGAAVLDEGVLGAGRRSRVGVELRLVFEGPRRPQAFAEVFAALVDATSTLAGFERVSLEGATADLPSRRGELDPDERDYRSRERWLDEDYVEIEEESW
jgi:hypothetical protein